MLSGSIPPRAPARTIPSAATQKWTGLPISNAVLAADGDGETGPDGDGEDGPADGDGETGADGAGVGVLDGTGVGVLDGDGVSVTDGGADGAGVEWTGPGVKATIAAMARAAVAIPASNPRTTARRGGMERGYQYQAPGAAIPVTG